MPGLWPCVSALCWKKEECIVSIVRASPGNEPPKGLDCHPKEGNEEMVTATIATPGETLSPRSLAGNMEIFSLQTIVLDAVFLSDGKIASCAYACDPKTVKVCIAKWTHLNIRERIATEMLSEQIGGHLERFKSFFTSKDGKMLVSGHFDGAVRVWNGTTGLQVCALRTIVWDLNAVNKCVLHSLVILAGLRALQLLRTGVGLCPGRLMDQ